MTPPASRERAGPKPGTFKKGQSGNPAGRKVEFGPIKELARQHTGAAINTLVKALNAKSERTRVAAAEAILDRGYGKASQHIELDAGDELTRRLAEALKRNGGG